MKTNHYPNKITFYLVTVVPMTSFTLKSTSKLVQLLKSRWPYSMQSRFWVDKLKGLFQKSCFCAKVKIDRWHKIQGSHKLEWLYVLLPVRIYITSSKKVTDYL